MTPSTSTRPIQTVPAAATPSAPGNPYVLRPGEDPDANNIVRKFSLALVYVVVFLRLSGFQYMETFLLHVNLKLLYIFSIPAILGTVLCGGLQRSFRWSPAYYWTGFTLWMIAITPFSSWVGGSASVAFTYVRTNLIMVFFAGGLVIGWKECQTFLRTCAYGAFGTLLLARIFQNPKYQDRFALELGTVANPNDFACHLLLCLPFIYWAMVSTKSIVVRLLCLGGIGYGVLVIVQTASRGGLLGLIAIALCLLVWGSGVQRMALLALLPVAVAGVIAIVPQGALTRIVSFSASEQNASEEALLSSQQRQYLLRKSIEYAFTHPIFGVGPGQFPNYEGTRNRYIGSHGAYHGTHNTFTQVASETGLPGLLLFTGGLLASFRIFFVAFRKARRRPDCVDIKNAMLSLMLAMIGFVVSFTFLNFAYFFYQPLLGGIAVAIKSATDAEFAERDRAAQAIGSTPMAPSVFHPTSPVIA